MKSFVHLRAASALSLLLVACAADTEEVRVGAGEDQPVVSSEAALEIAMAPGHDIPGTGTPVARFKPVDDAIRKFMSERCIGASVIGIGYQGGVIHNRGFGYKNGPPNAKCGTPEDPFVGGAKMGAADPIRIGSNSKAILAAVFRKELKRAIAAKLGGPEPTDAELEALTLLDNGKLDLVSDRVRTAMLADNAPGDIGDKSNGSKVPKAWNKVTLGMLLNHTAGIPAADLSYENLAAIRGLSSAQKLAAQEAASGATGVARQTLKGIAGNNAYFVPAQTLEEIMLASSDKLFNYTPGTSDAYSNTGFNVLDYVLELVTGGSFAARNGQPSTHQASLLADFTATELGTATGIEHSHTALGARDALEPRYRHWSKTQQTYYFTQADDKRPWCVLSGGTCKFDGFAAGDLRFNWYWSPAHVEQTYHSNSVAPGAGALAVEAPVMLAFMNRFTMGSPYGGDRVVYGGDHQHFGGLEGTASWAVQFGGGTWSYPGFGKNRDGSTNFEETKRTKGSCKIPAGVDVVYTINQTADKSCTAANGCKIIDKDNEPKDAYSVGYYSGVLLEALCKVDWNFPPQ